MIDWTTESGAQIAGRLREESIIWLTTVRADGIPQPTSVWFRWDQESFLIYSQPGAQKLRNIAHSPKVALKLNSDEWDGSVIIFTGEASIDPQATPADRVPGYVDKYRDAIVDLDMTLESFASSYSVAIRVKPQHARGL